MFQIFKHLYLFILTFSEFSSSNSNAYIAIKWTYQLVYVYQLKAFICHKFEHEALSFLLFLYCKKYMGKSLLVLILQPEFLFLVTCPKHRPTTHFLPTTLSATTFLPCPRLSILHHNNDNSKIKVELPFQKWPQIMDYQARRRKIMS